MGHPIKKSEWILKKNVWCFCLFNPDMNLSCQFVKKSRLWENKTNRSKRPTSHNICPTCWLSISVDCWTQSIVNLSWLNCQYQLIQFSSLWKTSSRSQVDCQSQGNSWYCQNQVYCKLSIRSPLLISSKLSIVRSKGNCQS